MPTVETVCEVDLAREVLIRFLALSLSDPHREPWQALRQKANQQVAQAAAELILCQGQAHTPDGPGEQPLERLDLQGMLRELRNAKFDLRAEYNRVFGLVASRECMPYGTEYYRTTEPFFRAQRLADIAGFYRAFGLQESRRMPERPDHVALELEFLSFLLTKQRLAQEEFGPFSSQVRICQEAWEKFFREHVVWWMGSFAQALARRAGEGFYYQAAQVLGAWLGWERTRRKLPVRPRLAQCIEPPEEQPPCGACSFPGGEQLVALQPPDAAGCCAPPSQGEGP